MQHRLRGKENHHKEDEEFGIWDCGSLLYDSYEFVSISHLIERHLMALPYSLGGSRRFITNIYTHYSSGMASTVSSDMRSSSTTREAKRRRVLFGERKGKNKKRKLGFSGFCKMIGLWRQRDLWRKELGASTIVSSFRNRQSSSFIHK
ncbi:unnamed protein product [Malus baccata var. baccata]